MVYPPFVPVAPGSNPPEKDKTIQEILNPGWFSDSNGMPQFVEEQDWIRGFKSKYGRAPTLKEAGDWLGRQNTANWNFAPGSTPYETGFRTAAEYNDLQSYGQTYGPWGGSLVQPGGVVVTDKTGRPTNRLYQKDVNGPAGIFEGYLKSGQYYNPPESPEYDWMGNRAGRTTIPQLYGSETPATSAFNLPPDQTQPTPSTEFQPSIPAPEQPQPAPSEVYTAKLQDYMNDVLPKDEATINQMAGIYKQIIQLSSNPDQAAQQGYDLENEIAIRSQKLNELQSQLSPLTQGLNLFQVVDSEGNALKATPGPGGRNVYVNGKGEPVTDIDVITGDIMDVYDQYLSKANNVIKTGKSPSWLPAYDVVMKYAGGNNYARLLDDLNKEYSQDYEEWNKRATQEKGRWAAGQAEEMNARTQAMAASRQSYVPENEKNDFIQLVYGLDWKPETRNWILANQQMLFNKWNAAGRPNKFTEFVKLWLSGRWTGG